MHPPKNKAVQDFLDSLSAIDPEKFEVLAACRNIILDTFSKADEKIMYGGLVFFSNGEMFSGLFANKQHITLEFSDGSRMEDPGGRLEGKGKYRRHVKLKQQTDLSAKQVAFFVAQQYELM